MQDSLQLAKASTMYANVGFTDTETATSALTSVLQAFYNGVNDVGSAAESAVDKFVKIGNNFAITSAELGEGLQESASAIVAAGKQYCLNIQKCILRIHLIARYS